MDYASYSYISVTKREGIAFLQFNRPERLNAVDHDDHIEFGRILRDLAADDEVRVAVVSGAGKAFSLGATYEYLDQLLEDPQLVLELQDHAREMVRAHVELEKPIIAAVNGFATGSGLMFALLSDIVIAERGALLADGHLRIALAAGDGGVLVWPLAVGLTRAKRYLLTGDWISAEEAERIGLVTEVVEPGDSLRRATEFAERFARAPQRALQYTKRALNQWLHAGANLFDYSLALEVQTFTSTPEQVRAAVEKIRSKTADLH